MRENEYFQQALANFTYEVAGGGAIRHLTEAGYTVKQIMEQLDFPVPYEKVRRAVWEHLVRTRGVLLEEPGSGTRKEKAVYVREYDKFGRAAFRQVVEEDTDTAVGEWKEYREAGGGCRWKGICPRSRCFPLCGQKYRKTGMETPMFPAVSEFCGRRSPTGTGAVCSAWRSGSGNTWRGCPGRTGRSTTDWICA